MSGTIKFLTVCSALLVMVGTVQAQTAASVSYTPSWQARHHLQWLADHAGLPITVTHWPLPAAAVELALSQWALPAHADNEAVKLARDFVLKELDLAQSRGRAQLLLRTKSEALNAYGDAYAPGSRAQVLSAEGRWVSGDVSAAGRLGASLEVNPHSLSTHLAGSRPQEAYPWRPDGTEAVVAWGGWNMQVFSRQNWWGPGWQSSLVNGHNSPAWSGAGLQRGSVQASDSAWLSWMGPWNLDVFVAKAQDPVVVQAQPSGFVFSGMRLTMKPQPWLEVGLSRGLQAGGAGRPSGIRNFVKSFFGQEVNQNPGDPPDTSGQIAGYDVRATCPVSWACAAYTQWMGEDAAGNAIPLPYKFMSLWGVEKTYASGRYRVFAEWTDTHANSLPWETQPVFPGYVNGVYRQGYTQGGRWVGPAQGAGSRVLTLGWLDAAQQRQFKLHAGTVQTSLGSFNPSLVAPHGRMWGGSAKQSIPWMGMTLTPELAYTHLAEGEDQGANRSRNLRLGIMMSLPL